MAKIVDKRVQATESEIRSGDIGICIKCGEEAYGVEPDARRYTCECCDKPGVFGLEELLIMGVVDLID